ncbi:MAG: phosphatidylglycerophosphatase A [Terriglobia bacterium]
MGVVKERRSLSIWIATGLGSGYFPVAPGTAGSALGLALVIAFRQTSLDALGLAVTLAVCAALLFVVGVWSAGKAEKVFGRVDPGQVVIDEVVGQIITFVATPRVSWIGLIAGFILFRAFDIVKPFPARRAERLPGGWGIMVDDVVAGLYSLMVLVVLGHFIK